MCVLSGVNRCTTVAVEQICAMWKPYCSVMYVKYVYSAHCHMVNCSDFICDTYVYTSSIKTCQIFSIWHICRTLGSAFKNMMCFLCFFQGSVFYTFYHQFLFFFNCPKGPSWYLWFSEVEQELSNSHFQQGLGVLDRLSFKSFWGPWSQIWSLQEPQATQVSVLGTVTSMHP